MSAAKMSRSTKPVDSKTKERYAELIGLGLSHREAAGATGISGRAVVEEQ